MAVELLKIKIDRVAFRKEDSGWCILLTNKGCCKGVVEWEPQDGDCYKLEGKWRTSDFNGDLEFNFTACILEIESDKRALLHYACSITSGLGRSKEDEIWKLYGDKWEEHHELMRVCSLSEQTRQNWLDTLNRLKQQKLQSETIAYMIGKNCSLKLANKAWVLWEQETKGRVDDNCYCLTDLPRCGFTHVDEKIRRNFGITNDDPRRVEAAYLYMIKVITEDGDTVVTFEEVKVKVTAMCSVTLEELLECQERLIGDGKVVVVGDDEEELLIALAEDFYNEEWIHARFQ